MRLAEAHVLHQAASLETPQELRGLSLVGESCGLSYLAVAQPRRIADGAENTRRPICRAHRQAPSLRAALNHRVYTPRLWGKFHSRASIGRKRKGDERGRQLGKRLLRAGEHPRAQDSKYTADNQFSGQLRRSYKWLRIIWFFVSLRADRACQCAQRLGATRRDGAACYRCVEDQESRPEWLVIQKREQRRDACAYPIGPAVLSLFGASENAGKPPDSLVKCRRDTVIDAIKRITDFWC